MERMMEVFQKICNFLFVISKVTLVFMVLLTTTEIVLRAFGSPITGAFELVILTAPVLIGFGLPYTSWKRGHVYMVFLIERIPNRYRNIVNIFTRLISIALFGLLAFNLFVVGMNLNDVGEVTPTLQLPFYPVVYLLGICCVIVSLVLVCDIVKIYRGYYE